MKKHTVARTDPRALSILAIVAILFFVAASSDPVRKTYLTTAPDSGTPLTDDIAVWDGHGWVYQQQLGAGAGGEANTITSVGGGFGLAAGKVGIDLRVNSITNGSTITWSSNDYTLTAEVADDSITGAKLTIDSEAESRIEAAIDAADIQGISSYALVSMLLTNAHDVDGNLWITNNAGTAGLLVSGSTTNKGTIWIGAYQTSPIYQDYSGTLSFGGTSTGYTNYLWGYRGDLNNFARIRVSHNGTTNISIVAETAGNGNDNAGIWITPAGTGIVTIGTGTVTPYVQVGDLGYNSTTWDGSTNVPTRNAIRDELVSMSSTISGKQNSDTDLDALAVSGSTGSGAFVRATALAAYQLSDANLDALVVAGYTGTGAFVRESALTSGGAPQTPWTEDIDAANYSLTNAGTIKGSNVVASVMISSPLLGVDQLYSTNTYVWDSISESWLSFASIPDGKFLKRNGTDIEGALVNLGSDVTGDLPTAFISPLTADLYCDNFAFYNPWGFIFPDGTRLYGNGLGAVKIDGNLWVTGTIQLAKAYITNIFMPPTTLSPTSGTNFTINVTNNDPSHIKANLSTNAFLVVTGLVDGAFGSCTFWPGGVGRYVSWPAAYHSAYSGDGLWGTNEVLLEWKVSGGTYQSNVTISAKGMEY